MGRGLSAPSADRARLGQRPTRKLHGVDSVGTSLSSALIYAVAISPSGNRVLVGSQHDINLHHAADFGWMLELDGTWSRTRAHSGKDIVGISLTSDTEGFAIG